MSYSSWREKYGDVLEYSIHEIGSDYDQSNSLEIGDDVKSRMIRINKPRKMRNTIIRYGLIPLSYRRKS